MRDAVPGRTVGLGEGRAGSAHRLRRQRRGAPIPQQVGPRVGEPDAQVVQGEGRRDAALAQQTLQDLGGEGDAVRHVPRDGSPGEHPEAGRDGAAADAVRGDQRGGGGGGTNAAGGANTLHRRQIRQDQGGRQGFHARRPLRPHVRRGLIRAPPGGQPRPRGRHHHHRDDPGGLSQRLAGAPQGQARGGDHGPEVRHRRWQQQPQQQEQRPRSRDSTGLGPAQTRIASRVKSNIRPFWPEFKFWRWPPATAVDGRAEVKVSKAVKIEPVGVGRECRVEVAEKAVKVITREGRVGAREARERRLHDQERERLHPLPARDAHRQADPPHALDSGHKQEEDRRRLG